MHIHPITDTWVVKIKNMLTTTNVWELYSVLNTELSDDKDIHRQLR